MFFAYLHQVLASTTSAPASPIALAPALASTAVSVSLGFFVNLLARLTKADATVLRARVERLEREAAYHDELLSTLLAAMNPGDADLHSSKEEPDRREAEQQPMATPLVLADVPQPYPYPAFAAAGGCRR